MNQQLVLQDLVIVIAAKNHKPGLLNPDFLKCSGIIPSDWELARQPVNANNVSQVVFINGITITAEPQRIIFAQPVKDVDVESILIPEIARKYVNALPLLEFEAVGINPRGYVPFLNGEQETARQYITQTLLSPGAWQSEGEEPMRASLNLLYKLPRAPFYLTVTEAALQAKTEDETVTPIILFSGSFSYELNSEDNAEKLQLLDSVINNWQSDLEDYRNIIGNKFLQGAQKILPVGEYNLGTNNDTEANHNSETNNLFAMSV
ncbi:MAG: hypothetical protein ACFCUV_18230 [Rivularia sp. (in: cyanobacteria)]